MVNWLLFRVAICKKNCYEDIKDGVCYIKDQRDRVIIKFDIPKISQMERENRKELNNILDEVFG